MATFTAASGNIGENSARITGVLTDGSLNINYYRIKIDYGLTTSYGTTRYSATTLYDGNYYPSGGKFYYYYDLTGLSSGTKYYYKVQLQMWNTNDGGYWHDTSSSHVASGSFTTIASSEEGYAKFTCGTGCHHAYYAYIHDGTRYPNRYSTPSGSDLEGYYKTTTDTGTIQCEYLFVHQVYASSGYDLPWSWSAISGWGSVSYEGSTNSNQCSLYIYPNEDGGTSHTKVVSISFSQVANPYTLYVYWMNGTSRINSATYTSASAFTQSSAEGKRSDYTPNVDYYIYDSSSTLSTSGHNQYIHFYYTSMTGSIVFNPSLTTTTNLYFTATKTAAGSGNAIIVYFNNELYSRSYKDASLTSRDYRFSFNNFENASDKLDLYWYSGNSSNYSSTGKLLDHIGGYAHKLSYDANGGSGAPSAQLKFDSTLSITFSISNTTPTRSGYNFLGWSTNPNASTASYDAGDSISISQNTILYAVWGPATYTVKCYCYSGSGTFTIAGTSVAAGVAVTVNAGSNVTVVASPASGYTYGYWCTSGGTSTGTGNTKTISNISEDTVLYYYFKVAYTISYAPNGGSTTPSSQTFASGDTVTVANSISRSDSWSPAAQAITVSYNFNGGSGSTSSANTNGSKTTTYHYNFLYWSTTYGGAVHYINGGASFSPPAQNLTLTAEWNDMYNPTYSYGTVTLPTPNARTYYTFNGWYTAATGGTRIGGAGDSYSPTEDITLYAQWSLNVSGTISIYSKTTTSLSFTFTKSGSGNGTIVLTQNGTEVASQAISGTASSSPIIFSNLTPNTSYVATLYEGTGTNSRVQLDSITQSTKSVTVTINVYVSSTLYTTSTISGLSSLNTSYTLPAGPTVSGYKFKYWQGDGNHYSANTAYTFGASDYTTVDDTNANYTLYTKEVNAYFVALMGKFYWSSANTEAQDAIDIQSGNDVATYLKATKWNTLIGKIRTMNASLYLPPDQEQGDTIYALYFNYLRVAIGSLPGATTVPSEKSRGSAILASDFHGSGSIKQALNDAIDTYNSNL